MTKGAGRLAGLCLDESSMPVAASAINHENGREEPVPEIDVILAFAWPGAFRSPIGVGDDEIGAGMTNLGVGTTVGEWNV